MIKTIKNQITKASCLTLFCIFTSCDGGSSDGGSTAMIEEEQEEQIEQQEEQEEEVAQDVVERKEAVTLEFSPATLPGGSRVESIWVESGFRIESGHMASHSATSTSSTGFRASNGTDYLTFSIMAFGSGAIQISNVEGNHFEAVSVDLSEYSHVFPEPKDITFIGTKDDGSQVSVTFTTDGNISGPGDDNDFETFIFPPTFNSLTLLEIPEGIFGMDNLSLISTILE